MKINNLPIEGTNLDIVVGGAAFGNRVDPITKRVAKHNGIDINRLMSKAPINNKPILAVSDGKAIVSKMQGNGKGYGNYVVIRHAGGYSLSAHMSKRAVEVGRLVKAGDVIGYVGSTGDSTGPHLHFGICMSYNTAVPDRSDWINPLPLLKSIKEDKEMVVKQKMLIDGKMVTVEAIEKDGFNFVKLRDLESIIKVGYDKKRNLPIVNKK